MIINVFLKIVIIIKIIILIINSQEWVNKTKTKKYKI
jgi:hypothetical protein